MSQARIQWGVLGAAQIARNRWMPAAMKCEHATVAAIASSHLEQTSRQLLERFGALRLYGNYQELLADPHLQAVYIPLPNHLHYEWCLRAAEHGKHVLCEKPLTLESRQGAELFEAFAARSLLLVEAIMYRFDPRIQKVKALLHDGVIGPVRRVKASFTFNLTDRNNIRLRKESGGGALFDIGSYTINVCRYLFASEPSAVHAELRSRQHGEVEDEGEATLFFPEDRLGIIDFSFNTPWHESVVIEGDQGRIEVPAPFTARGIQPSILIVRQDFGRNEPRFTTETLGSHDFYALETESFSRKLLGLDDEVQTIVPPFDSVRNLRVVEAIRRSAISESRTAVET
jgi:D-xylose 1-dehydrogenase (NADP+, D-xylono-1,5-lactone-forming)